MGFRPLPLEIKYEVDGRWMYGIYNLAVESLPKFVIVLQKILIHNTAIG